MSIELPFLGTEETKDLKAVGEAEEASARLRMKVKTPIEESEQAFRRYEGILLGSTALTVLRFLITSEIFFSVYTDSK